MNAIRRGFLGYLGALLINKPARAGELTPVSSSQDSVSPATGSSVKPRHVLCFLGGERNLARLSDAASHAIKDFATGFSIDNAYSRNEPNEQMSRSFEVCWDRVQPDAWSTADEQAVANHQSVLYVLGPPMTADNAVTVSAGALLLVSTLIATGAIAVKGESAGVAHGLDRWRELIVQGSVALKSDDDFSLRRTCRLAFAKRPLASQHDLESVGFHLVGQPEVYVPKSRGSEREIVAIMDAVADEIAQRGLQSALKHYDASLSFASSYEDDDFKFNPYGIVTLPS